MEIDNGDVKKLTMYNGEPDGLPFVISVKLWKMFVVGHLS